VEIINHEAAVLEPPVTSPLIPNVFSAVLSLTLLVCDLPLHSETAVHTSLNYS